MEIFGDASTFFHSGGTNQVLRLKTMKAHSDNPVSTFKTAEGFAMHGAWYDSYGPDRKMFQVEDLETPEAGAVRLRLSAPGVNSSDSERRLDSRAEMKWPIAN